MAETPLMIRDYPVQERPRERMLISGPDTLANHELLAIILRTGSKNESVIHLANRIIQHFEGLRFLKDATIGELKEIHGIGDAKAVELLAAIELGRRISRLPFDERFAIRSPDDGAQYMMDELRFLQQEHFVCLYLNTKNQIIHKKTIFIGSLNSSIVHPREVSRKGSGGQRLPLFVSTTTQAVTPLQVGKISTLQKDW